ncbi:polyphosphatase [Monosporozyma servazzii]
MSVSTLRQFLEFINSRSINSFITPASRLSIVCGNESADFDSVSSALSYAYFDYLYQVQTSQLNNITPLVPVINIPHEDLKLRKDITFMLEKEYSISEDLLFFHEDLIRWKTENNGLQIDAVLVDHNELVNESKKLIDNVIGIIDHHEDLGLYTDAKPRIVQVTGSCTSLVYNYWNGKIEDKSAMNDMIKFMYGAVLLDTANFKHKVEDPDREAVKSYQLFESESKMNLLSQDGKDTFSQEQFFKTLKKAKKDITGLSVRDIMKKDYKQFEFNVGSTGKSITVGIGSMVKSLKWLYKEYNGVEIFREECEKYRKEFNLDVVVVMSSSNDKKTGSFNREMALVSSPENQALVMKMIDAMTPILQLEPHKHIPTATCWEYKQLNVDASRKQVVPCIKRVLEQL